MSGRIGCAVLVVAAALLSSGVVAEDRATVTMGQRVTVELVCKAPIAVSAGSSTSLDEAALALLQSSQSNSELAGWHFPRAEVQAAYRGALASNHLRVKFPTVRVVESMGGSLQVREIIVRLGSEANREQFADRFVDSLFTVDDRGTVVGHALYSGERFIAIWRAVRDATGGTQECNLPQHVPGFT